MADIWLTEAAAADHAATCEVQGPPTTVLRHRRPAPKGARVIFERAYQILRTVQAAWPGPYDPRLARPFGNPAEMPAHRWRASPDVMQALWDASPPPYSVVNPKSSVGATPLLFGWPIETDRSLPPDSMILEPL